MQIYMHMHIHIHIHTFEPRRSAHPLARWLRQPIPTLASLMGGAHVGELQRLPQRTVCGAGRPLISLNHLCGRGRFSRPSSHPALQRQAGLYTSANRDRRALRLRCGRRVARCKLPSAGGEAYTYTYAYTCTYMHVHIHIQAQTAIRRG